MKIRPVGAASIHADGRTDRHYDANRRFSQILQRAYLSRYDYFSRVPIAANSTCQFRHVHLPPQSPRM